MRKVFVALVFAASATALLRGQSAGQTILLDNFESGAIRIADPNSTDPVYHYLWNQYTGDFYAGPDPGLASISNVFHTGSKSLQVNVTGGSLYASFYPNDGAVWHFMREYVTPKSGWTFDTYNRLRFWIKVPKSSQANDPGVENIQIGTYVRSKNGDMYQQADGGGHYYHFYNIPYTGEWHQVILDWHPNHLVSESGQTEWGERQYPTGESGFNYFDALTRFYIDYQTTPTSYPATWYLDDFEVYRDPNPENVKQIYSLHGVYVPSSNKILVGWMRRKDEETVKDDVKYAFQDIFSLGWSNATAAPNGTVSALNGGAYNGMEYSTTAINVQGRDKIYVGIKPQNSSSFRQIVIPVSGSGSVPSAPASPTNVKIIS